MMTMGALLQWTENCDPGLGEEIGPRLEHAAAGGWWCRAGADYGGIAWQIVWGALQTHVVHACVWKGVGY
jgi:hypothetical protein